MSRQISFFHAEPDAVRFLQEIDRRGGTFWIGNAAVPPLRSCAGQNVHALVQVPYRPGRACSRMQRFHAGGSNN